MGTIQTKIVVLGLDNSGKSAIVKYLKSKGEPIESQPNPSTGYDLVDVKYKGVTLSLWDVAGKETLRGLWRHYFEKTDAIVWVVDSSDKARREESLNSLKRYALDEDALAGTILLVLANKQDLPGAAAPVRAANDQDEHLPYPRTSLRLPNPSRTLLAISASGTLRAARLPITRFVALCTLVHNPRRLTRCH